MHPQKAEIAALRAIILKANPKIDERVKWNAPSFFYFQDMAAFNPRAKGLVRSGAGLLQGEWKDIREARFSDLKDVKSKRALLRDLVNAWVKPIDE